METLLETGYKKAQTTGPSDFMWNRAVNDWAGSFRDTADIMVESKAKNQPVLLSHKYFQGEHNVKKWLNPKNERTHILGWCGL